MDPQLSLSSLHPQATRKLNRPCRKCAKLGFDVQVTVYWFHEVVPPFFEERTHLVKYSHQFSPNTCCRCSLAWFSCIYTTTGEALPAIISRLVMCGQLAIFLHVCYIDYDFISMPDFLGTLCIPQPNSCGSTAQCMASEKKACTGTIIIGFLYLLLLWLNVQRIKNKAFGLALLVWMVTIFW